MNLKTARLKAKMTQEELAEISGVTVQTISALENGKTKNGYIETRRCLEKALGQRINWLATIGLNAKQVGQMTSWESVEQKFRGALSEINALQPNERFEFIKLAKEYLETFERDLTKST